MSSELVNAADAGRMCPFCCFPLKADVAAHRCEACGALHHADCWTENGGCAVVGCTGGEATAAMPAAGAGEVPPAAAVPPAPAAVPPGAAVPPAAAVPPTAAVPPAPAAPPLPQPPAPPTPAAPAYAPPPPAPPSPPPAGSDRHTLVGVVIGLAVAGAGIGGYLVAHNDGGGGDDPPVRTVAQPGTTSSVTTPAPNREEEQQITAMRAIAAAVALSQDGRTAVREGRFFDAIDNRKQVLRQLDAIDGAQGRVADARDLLHSAMEASLASDRAYAANGDATASDALATARKRAFVNEWNALAGRYGLQLYTETQI